MTAPMSRGANVSLTREVPGLARVGLGISWNAGSETVLSDSLVAATALCDARSKVLSPEHFVFFNQVASPDGSVAESAAMGHDQELVEVELAAVPAEVDRVVVLLYINEGLTRRRSLGQLRSCVVRVVDLVRGNELVRSEDLAPALHTETALTLGELYRHGSEWKFRVLGQGYSGGLKAVAADIGLPL